MLCNLDPSQVPKVTFLSIHSQFFFQEKENLYRYYDTDLLRRPIWVFFPASAKSELLDLKVPDIHTICPDNRSTICRAKICFKISHILPTKLRTLPALGASSCRPPFVIIRLALSLLGERDPYSSLSSGGVAAGRAHLVRNRRLPSSATGVS